jgi:hypothetical protein
MVLCEESNAHMDLSLLAVGIRCRKNSAAPTRQVRELWSICDNYYVPILEVMCET